MHLYCAAVSAQETEQWEKVFEVTFHMPAAGCTVKMQTHKPSFRHVIAESDSQCTWGIQVLEESRRIPASMHAPAPASTQTLYRCMGTVYFVSPTMCGVSCGGLLVSMQQLAVVDDGRAPLWTFYIEGDRVAISVTPKVDVQ